MYNLATNNDVSEPYYFNRSHRVYDEEAAGLPRPRRRKTVNNNAEEHRRFTFLSCFRGTVIWTMLLILIMMYISIYDHLIAKPRYENALWLLEKTERF